jgi:hypothetical protein
MNQLLEYANEVISDYPDLREDITELVQLCKDSIDEGESSDNEITICFYGIKELIEQ